MPAMIKAVIYDLDDLMVNSYEIHVRATNLLLKQHGVDASNIPKEVNRRFVGMRISDILKTIISYINLNVDFESFYKERNRIFLDLVKKELKPMPGLNESLSYYRQREFKIALASSGTKKYIEMVLDRFKIKEYFDVIISGDHVKHGKPNPEIYRLTLNELSVKPSEAVVLEDAEVGIESAKGAGCYCIAVANPNTPTQDLSKADKIINSLNEINTVKLP